MSNYSCLSSYLSQLHTFNLTHHCIEPRTSSVTSGTLKAAPKGVVIWQFNDVCLMQPPAYSRDADKPAYHNFSPRQIAGTDKWLNVVAGVWLLYLFKDDHGVHML